MADMSPQLQQALEEWLASLSFGRRLAVRAGLYAGGYTDWRGNLRPVAGGIGCLVVIAAIIAGLLIALGIASCATR